jgi:hypothetical protein
MSDDILDRLSAQAPRVEQVDTSFGPFWMQSISGERHFHFLKVQKDLTEKGASTIPPSFIVAVALCREDGTPLHADLDQTMQIIWRMDKDKMYELYDHALRVTGLGAKALEEAEKKSSSSQSLESGTTSPVSSEAAQ